MNEYFTSEFENQPKFKHFSTSRECIQYIQRNNIQNVQHCCSKTGFCIVEKETGHYSGGKRDRTDKDKPIVSEICNDDEICCVCLNSNKRKTPCSHFLCINCENQLTKSECPYCRQKLQNNNAR
jgi:hypothetical protein